MVSELLKFGGVDMVKMLGKLYVLTWKEEVPMKWRGLIVSLFKRGDKEYPGVYRGITLLSVVGKVFCKILNDLWSSIKIKVVKFIKDKQAFMQVGVVSITSLFSMN